MRPQSKSRRPRRGTVMASGPVVWVGEGGEVMVTVVGRGQREDSLWLVVSGSLIGEKGWGKRYLRALATAVVPATPPTIMAMRLTTASATLRKKVGRRKPHIVGPVLLSLSFPPLVVNSLMPSSLSPADVVENSYIPKGLFGGHFFGLQGPGD